MSILRNFPVVLGQRQIGLLQSVSLNEAQNQVLALIVSCGIRGKRVILPESVEAIGKGFVVVRGVQRYKRKYEAAPCSFVRDASGLLCGRVTDYALDDETFAVQAFEMSPGYLGKARRTRLWIYDYRRSESHAEELIIPALLGHELTFARDISDHIIFMDKGLIAVEGTPQEVFASDHVRMKEFLGKFHQG